MTATRTTINFTKGPVYCTQCGRVMRPTRHNFGAWPKDSIVYGAWGRCELCVAGEASVSPSTVVVGTAPTAPTPAAPPAPSPGVMPRRRPRRRFDYTPPAADLCFSCGRRIDPFTGECRCSS
ncbi:hypothetical protein [Actinomyces bowdenii]|uniref:Uncharacterized protein n=1 Tax=Actinomyces bowdenii TaxID=131109 RepID=A0A853EG57_9ACTO|nr:hypothetical protein [Actinomyces bowdenii]MBF0696106.1 hypothetical protein [Actinomyces bowdenii]NYS68279.1 hypothetical protein [Actinomyces bowdenii]